MAKATQEKRVLAYINDFGSITQAEASNDIGVSRLASRISDLKKKGYPIISKKEQVKNRYGETCYISRYSIQKDEGDKPRPSSWKTNICFDCKKACGGCSWSERFEPVPGWKAKKVVQKSIVDKKVRVCDTYQIVSCPLFERDEKRKRNREEVTDEQFKVLLERWRLL